MDTPALLQQLGVNLVYYEGNDLPVRSPINGTHIATLRCHSNTELDEALTQAQKAFHLWRIIPAPKRGELIRRFGETLRKYKEPLAQLVTVECGKIIEEGRGEVQEMIDICDFAVGLSRQLYGLTIASERPQHVMQERWLPLGVVGIISAFNFPVAVWAWNATLALVCGNSLIWKPSEKTPLTALACQSLLEETIAGMAEIPEGLSHVLIGERTLGEAMVNDARIALVSATGSTRMGREVGPQTARRFGKSLLELGGNNAVIVTPSADLGVALPSLIFGAVGTCGQRCTTTRRAFVHQSIADNVWQTLTRVYTNFTLKIGNPLEVDTLIGPLIDTESFGAMQDSLTEARKAGCEVLGGERILEEEFPDAYYVTPALVRATEQSDFIRRETFAPILYVMPYDMLENALQQHNDVPQGLSSAIFTTDIREAEYFRQESDCGIANINIGTSGAEIGGAFGGEKETGGGRESGSDAWKYYMRRQTSTSYFGTTPPALAQGIHFKIGS